MLRITRYISANRIAQLVELEGVCKVEIRRRKQDFKKPLIRVQIYLCNDFPMFKSVMCNIINWANEHKCGIAKETACQALIDGFIKESAFLDFNYPMPKKYKKYSELYTQEFFNQLGDSKISIKQLVKEG